MTMTCKHETIQTGPDYGYMTTVAVPPYTDENRAAHGGITRTEECVVCGAQRARWLRVDELRAAAEQPDTGDGLVPFYRALHRAACRAIDQEA